MSVKPDRVEFYALQGQKQMYKREGDRIILLVAQGRNMGADFDHTHKTLGVLESEVLDFTKMQPATAEDWNELMLEYLGINKEKANIMSAFRQHQFETGKLKL